ncbi:MAG: hypothetical protein ACRDGM_02535 [bacterium]
MEGMLASWLVALGTVVIAAVAVFQETIRGWFYRPKFAVTVRCAPPDCVSVALTRRETGQFLANSVYLRLLVRNDGNATARNVEVYAERLQRRRADGTLEPLNSFPPMNLKWANLGQIYFPSIAPKMGKHCDIGHITEPAQRPAVNEENPALTLSNQQCSLTFDLMVAPNHRGHIIGPGEYFLEILVAAENAKPVPKTVRLNLPGPWYPDETRMLRDGVGVEVL